MIYYIVCKKSCTISGELMRGGGPGGLDPPRICYILIYLVLYTCFFKNKNNTFEINITF